MLLLVVAAAGVARVALRLHRRLASLTPVHFSSVFIRWFLLNRLVVSLFILAHLQSVEVVLEADRLAERTWLLLDEQFARHRFVDIQLLVRSLPAIVFVRSLALLLLLIAVVAFSQLRDQRSESLRFPIYFRLDLVRQVDHDQEHPVLLWHVLVDLEQLPLLCIRIVDH